MSGTDRPDTRNSYLTLPCRGVRGLLETTINSLVGVRERQIVDLSADFRLKDVDMYAKVSSVQPGC